MTRVDFYILANDNAQAREQYACRLAEKAFRLGHRVYIHTGSAQQTRQLDDLLWTFQQGSFLPHGLYGESGDTPAPVLLGHDDEPDASSQVLINLADDVPLFFSRFERVAELVDARSDIRQQGRTRYTFYKERGYPLQTHEIKR